MAQKEGTVNSQRLVIDFVDIAGGVATNPPPIWEALFLGLIAATDASFSEPFPAQYRIA